MQAEDEHRHVEQYKEQVKQMFWSHCFTKPLIHFLLHVLPFRWKKLTPV